MKRDWLSFIADAEERGQLEEAQAFREQLEEVYSMLEAIGADIAFSPPSKLDS